MTHIPTKIRVSVQQADFDAGQEMAWLKQDRNDVGAVVSFIGTVRQWLPASQADQTLTLEHYPGMTERVIHEQALAAQQQFNTLGISIIHRVGEMGLGEQIVLIAVVGQHRQATFACCEYLIDWLKTQAPFWKKEKNGENGTWVQAQASDEQALSRWQEKLARMR